MYKEFLNLSKLPFENVPDPDFFYDSGDFTRVFVNLTDSLRAGRGLMIVTGAIGSGKTTLSQMVMNEFSESLKLIWVAEPPQSGVDILIFIARELGLSPNNEDRIFLLNDIRSALLASDDRCLLILDEAHLMSDEAANTLKALNNLELNSKKLIQMFLLGQDELLEIINRPEMLPFKQRIALLEKIGRMERSEVRDYIRFRLNVAGGSPDIFTDDAIAAIAIGSGGVPRVINSLCDKALYHAGSKNNETAEIEDVYDAAQGMIDRKDIFQLMLSLRNRQMNDGEKSNAGEAHLTSETDVHRRGAPDFQSSPQASMAPPDNVSTREGSGDGGRRRLGVPLLHLALSIIALAASIIYFFER